MSNHTLFLKLILPFGLTMLRHFAFSQLQACQPSDAAAMFNLWFVFAYSLPFVALHVPSSS